MRDAIQQSFNSCLISPLFLSFSFCFYSQFDVVWDDLSVQEHLLFYARLKGVPKDFERTLVQHIAEMTELDGGQTQNTTTHQNKHGDKKRVEKHSDRSLRLMILCLCYFFCLVCLFIVNPDPFLKNASTLSGGMKRRLSLGISLIGNPKIWLLDEPSTGLSPETRREIWKIIETRKRRSRHLKGVGKSIVITTHSMEEADTLCDRIAILAAGGLQCVGSSSHLKQRFGEGFKLTLHLQHEFDRMAVEQQINQGGEHQMGEEYKQDATSSSSSAASVTVPISRTSAVSGAVLSRHIALVRFVTRMAPHAKLSYVEGKQVQWRLHSVDSQSSYAHASPEQQAQLASARTNEVLGIFNNMETHKSELLSHFDVLEWGLSQSSLEEVFLTIVNRYEEEESAESKKNK